MKATMQAPALVRPGVLQDSIRVEALTASIGAQLLNVNLGDASRDPDLAAAIHALLLQYRVLFLRDQDLSPREHAAFAARFGELEVHPAIPCSHDSTPCRSSSMTLSLRALTLVMSTVTAPTSTPNSAERRAT